MSNTRAISAQIIEQVCFHNMSLTDAFLIPELRPKEDDRAFVKEICFGTIRFWIQLQAILKTLLEKPLKNEDKDIECLLCVGLYQLIYMHVPDYALVNETVTATRILKKAWASKLVNKILRMAIEVKECDTSSLIKMIGGRHRAGIISMSGSGSDSDHVKSITAHYSHPNWIIDKIKLAYPENWEAILNANNQKAPLFLRINKTKTSRSDFEKLLQKNKIDYDIFEDLPNGILLKNALPVEKIPGFMEGLFSVQDGSGQKVIDYLDLDDNHVVLDACAAPGSKTTHILETHPAIKKLIALDLHRDRLSKIKDNITRLRLNKKNVKLIEQDVCDVNQWWDGELFDRILLDAPCSATGVIRRHPDIKILRKKLDIPNLARQQLNMLNQLWPLLKKDGKLIYTTCSIFPDENENVIKTFLSANPEATLLVSKQSITGDLNRDGFYYAVLINARTEPRT